AQRALDFGVPPVADHDDLAAFLAHAGDLDVDLGDQRTRGVEDALTALFGLGADGARDAVRREDHDRACGGVFEFVDEDGALGAQVFDHVAVVHDFVAHVDRRPVDFQCALDDLDGPVHAGAETARLCQDDLGAGSLATGRRRHGAVLDHSTPRILTSTCRSRPARGWLTSNRAASSRRVLSTPDWRPPLGATNSTMSPASNSVSGGALRAISSRPTQRSSSGLRSP